MEEPGQTRRLAAILAADVAGYSRLMGDDDKATVETLTQYRRVFVELIERHQGKLVDATGDSVLAVFDSPVQAVDCAIEVQRESVRRNRLLADHRQMKFRIGINLGDIIARDDGTVYGDGVNVAARLESLAVPGEIAISGAMYDQVESRFPGKFEFAGEQQVKNIAKPVRAYRSVPAGPQSAATPPSNQAGKSKSRMLALAALLAVVLAGAWLGGKYYPSGGKTTAETLALPKGPSVAVLPFNNMSGNKEDDYFSDGISEDIITALSQFRDLFVIARNSTFQFKGKAVDVREVGARLGVQFVLEGSVRRDNNRIRLTAQLLDARSGAHLWAENYDRDLAASSIFAIQDELTSKVVSKIGDPLKGMVSQTAMSDVNHKGDVGLSAYECVLKAKSYFATFDPGLHRLTRDCLEQATRTDPSYADAWAWLGLVYVDEYSFHYDPRPNSLERAVQAARKSVELDPSNQMGTWFLARALFFQRNFDEFLARAERAIALNPNNTAVLAGASVYLSYAEKWERGKELFERAVSLNPNPPWWYYVPPFYYHYRLGKDQNALEFALKMKASAPGIYWSHVTTAAAYAQLGRLEDARAATAALTGLVPDYAHQAREDFRKYNMTASLTSRMVDGLRKAGINVPDESP